MKLAAPPSYHDSTEQAHPSAARGLRRHIPIAHSEEGDGDEPQSRVHVACGFLDLPAGRESRTVTKPML